MTGLEAVLATLNEHYMFDDPGRIVAARAEGVLPRFVLGRAGEGCLWRFRFDLDRDRVIALARVASRERGVSFDGELPAPPERMAVLERILSETMASPRLPRTLAARRGLVTRGGVTVGELWQVE